MRSAIAAFVAGICLFHAGLSPAPATTVLLSLLCVRWLRCVSVYLLACLAGQIIAALAASDALERRWPVDRHGEDIIAVGTVDSIPQQFVAGGRFLFRPDAGQGLPPRVRVSWYLEQALPQPGTRWRLALRMRAPRGLLNPSGFDHERWLASRRIDATATVRALPAPDRLEPEATPALLAARTALDRAVTDAMDGHPRAAVIRGLVTGERGGIDRHAWEVFARTGTAHLMAISGLHIGIVATLVFLMVRTLLSGVARSRELAVLAGLCVAGCYAALAGFSVPTRRALFMLCAAAVQVCARRRGAAASAWFLALAAVVATDPFSPLTIGFWLSFGAVASIAWSVAYRRGQAKPSMQLLRIQWAVSLGLLPLSLWFFQRGSLAAPLVNLAAVPYFGLMVVPAALFSSVVTIVHAELGASAFALTLFAVDLGWQVMEWVAAMPWAQRFTPRPPAWSVALGIAAAAILLAPGPRVFRLVTGIVFAMPMLAWAPGAPAQGGWRLVMLDVGQGLAAVVQTRAHALVFDTGPSFGPVSDAGTRVVVPYLRAHGIRRPDLVIISHPHDDHQGGFPSVAAAFPGVPVLAGDPSALDGPAHACRAGQGWSWDGVRFRVLHPNGDMESANLVSCVIEVSGAGGRLLLTGDIEWPVELELARPGSPLRPVDVVVVAHHGSDTSSIPRFVRRTRPAWALVPAGFGNRWGFPARPVVTRWESVGSTVLAVGETGALVVDAIPGVGVRDPTRERARQRAWWRVE